MRTGLDRLAGRVIRVAACVCAYACLGAAAPDEDEPIVFRKPAEMPKVVTSAGGFVKVVAADVPGDEVGFRLPILQFTTRHIRELERVYKLEMPRGGTGLTIHALTGTTNDPRVVVRAVKRRGGTFTRVWLPSPGYSDLEELRFEIARAYFRAWIERHAAPERAGACGELPEWFVQGLMRAADARVSDDDRRFVLDLWSDARLPFFPALCTDLRRAKGRAAALSGYVAGWARERHLVKKILTRLAAGEAWDGARLAEDLTGERDPVRQDRANDERLARLTRAVLSPGAASAWDLQVFRSRLLLYPAVFDKNNGDNFTSWTFAEAAALAGTNSAVRAAALRKAREMPLCVLGRGEGLAAAGEAYRQFLLGAARGEEPARLEPLLREADGKLEAVVDEDRKDDNR